MGVPDSEASDERAMRHCGAGWEWALAGAVVLPALLVISSEPTAPAVGLACLVAGAAIVFAASRSAFRCNQSWRFSALTWGVALAVALTLYIGWGGYSERLAQPGDLNIVTLERGGFTPYQKPRIPPELTHELSRFVVSILALGVIAGTLEGASGSTRAAAGILLGVSWVACCTLIAVTAVVFIYVGTFLGSQFPAALRDSVLVLSVMINGAISGLLLGRVTDRVLRRGESATINP